MVLRRQNSALDDARVAVERSDRMQLPTQQTRTLAVRDETRAIRDALRALIQHAEAQERRIAVLERAGHTVDPMRPLA